MISSLFGPRYQFRFKDKSVDQCARCVQFRAVIRTASPVDRPQLAEEWQQHRRQADKGYLHRKKCKAFSKQAYEGISIPPPAPAIFPPGSPPVQFNAYANYTDFTECDMGGGCRTPWVKSGPQYFLRTLASKPYYICSTVRGSVAFWWNEQVAEFGANQICSVNYIYDMTRGVGAGRRVLWVDGTYSQSWNRVMWKYLVDATNPESQTFVSGVSNALYTRADMYPYLLSLPAFYLILSILAF